MPPPSSPPKTLVLAFDLYGTILSTESIAKQLSEHFGQEKAAVVATAWRKYQLEYTWRANCMGTYIPFSSITHRSLLHALSESSLSLSPPAITSLLHAYDSLSLFPDVAPALEALSSSTRKDGTIYPIIFSNGTNEMVTNSMRNSASLSPQHAAVFQDIITVDAVRAYKPAPEVYRYLAEKVGKAGGTTTAAAAMAEIVLVSGNPFDIVGAKSMGMRAIWVDRQGAGWQDRLVEEQDGGGPDRIVRGLGEVVEVAKDWM